MRAWAVCMRSSLTCRPTRGRDGGGPVQVCCMSIYRPARGRHESLGLCRCATCCEMPEAWASAEGRSGSRQTQDIDPM